MAYGKMNAGKKPKATKAKKSSRPKMKTKKGTNAKKVSSRY